MADPAENLKSDTVTITVEGERMNDDIELESSENSSKENGSCQSNLPPGLETKSKLKSLSEKSVSRLRPSLFLRPSALSGDFNKLKPSSVLSSPSSISSNKFASIDTSVDSLLDIPAKVEKTEIKPPVLPSVNIPAPSPLSNPDYVFGQNLLSRVVDRPESMSNGAGGMLFSAALSAENGKDTPKDEHTETSKESSSLLEDAARCQQQQSAKRKYEEVLVSTGEENEINILQIIVKLFAFEGGVWVERGRGTLRLNDTKGSDAGSRIVVRTLGSLRVVLNTKIWSAMEFARANERSIRTTALDASGQLKIFLIQGNATDISSLHTCMEIRLRRCKDDSKSQESQETESSKSADVPEKKDDGAEDDECSRPAKVLAVEATT